jgi:hypothetical protein
VKVNVGLERKLQRRPGRKRRWEVKNVTGLEFVGDWGDQEAHRRFRDEVQRQHPGWVVQGYARVD